MTTNEIKTKTIRLDHSVVVDGKETAELAMRDSRKVRESLTAARLARDAYGRGYGSEETEVCLFAVLCGVDVRVIEDLDMSDYAKLQEAYAGEGFTPARPISGAGSSPSGAMPAGD